MNELLKFKVDPILLNALNEDITDMDISTKIIADEGAQANVELIAKEEGVLAGIYIFERVFKLLDEKVRVERFKEDGHFFRKGEVLAKVSGSIETLLSGERVALNFIQRMSGIATKTRQMVELLAGTNIRLMDTRKTTPGLRILEKYAVRVGGGYNHRYNLSDLILLKDNHIQAAGGVKQAVTRAKKQAPFIKKVEVETETIEMVKEAVTAGADIIMLDNMTIEQMREAIDFIDGRAVIEASGNMTTENIENLKQLDIDYISSGSITHSAGVIDLSMKNLTRTDRVQTL